HGPGARGRSWACPRTGGVNGPGQAVGPRSLTVQRPPGPVGAPMRAMILDWTLKLLGDIPGHQHQKQTVDAVKTRRDGSQPARTTIRMPATIRSVATTSRHVTRSRSLKKIAASARAKRPCVLTSGDTIETFPSRKARSAVV